MSDDLVARIHGRDAQAIADFIAAHRPQLMAFIEPQLGAGLRRKVEPDDVFQETSAEAVRALPTAELGDRDPFSWLCQIAERRIIDLHRHFFGAQKRDAGREVPLGWCGGDPRGGLGTSVEAIMAAIDRAWSEKGVAILVDLGGAETNSEMAIEMLPESRRDRVVVCNAPVVEGAVMAATEAASGATLETVRRTAEELTPA